MKVQKYCNSFLICMSLFLLAGCEDKTKIMHSAIIDASNRMPVANFKTEYAENFPHAPVKFISTSYDPENHIQEYTWLINGKIYEGKEVVVSFPDAGQYEVSHSVSDEEHEATKTRYIAINDYPFVLIRLVGIAFSADVGDGAGNAGQPYVIAHSFSTDENSTNALQQSIVPNGAPENHWNVQPYSGLYFGENSGYVLFEGKTNRAIGFSLIVMDHDSRGFDWAGLFSKIFEFAAVIVKPFFPTASSVLEGLSKISDAVRDFLGDTSDDVIASFEILHQPNDRWGLDAAHYSVQNGVSIQYIVESMR